MTDSTRADAMAPETSSPSGAGIAWEPGEEDYPFAASAGESALDFVERWLATAGYARIEQDGVRYIHEQDVANLFNHVTADVELLRSRLDGFGDHIAAAKDHDATVARIESALGELRDALDILRR